METPSKSILTKNTFSPLSLPVSPVAGSPQKNLTGTARVARDITADLYNNIQKWNGLHIQGAQLVKQIVSLKDSNDSASKLYTPELDTFVKDLWDVTENLKTHKNVFEALIGHVNALSKLPHKDQPIFSTLEIEKYASHFTSICEAFLTEYEMKVLVLEHIAHCKNKSDAMFLASCWTHQLNVTNEINMKLEFLLIESGHRNYT